MQEKKTILVVEDELLLLQNIVSILEFNGFNTLKASNVMDAISIATTNIPHLILSDVMMEKVDGFELLKMIKENELTKNIPFIFLSALADISDKNKGISAGANAYLTKPFSGKELIKTINQYLVNI
jgi:two-component system, sensor histidine kinase and response regulator